MSKTRPKKSANPEEKLKTKEEEEEEEKKGDGHEAGEHKPQPAEQKWSDWIWDEEMKLYYRAKLANGVEWIYDYACPELHPATKKETVNIISEKFEFPKVEEKIVFVQPKYKFEVPSGRGSEYLVSVCEEMRAGPGMRGGSGKPAGGNAEEKVAEPVKVEGEAKAGGEEGKRKNVGVEREHQGRDQVRNSLQLENKVEEGRSRGTVKKQRMRILSPDRIMLMKDEAGKEKEGKVRRKDRERHLEKKDSKHKERGNNK